jgi:alkanesulfonate monooxygenase SsuD/methylene tetrahydromethanopterin reductase-like flavin-dependent oxidoreductase (luciferase family)
MSRRALERAGRIADGWLAQFSIDNLSEEEIRAGLDTMRAEGGARNIRVVVRVTGSPSRVGELATRLATLAGAGATEVIVDVDWEHEDGAARASEVLRSAAA